ncbi:4-hydroxy-tetrahydrodipicolinate synthase [Methanospirillum sp. J.3.6.1-F.2.7.3]|jgi:4-hydroxy-tetrahydrodipicolinate synthase|uniref:4-hydroxy-tetrahydrodipicolinate synthase n=2 Tax=Methanospirillum TaxID=2202 RepID=A0A8E7EIM5_9EURY|nr:MULTISPECIES: 4-hydroxy-tetrahydrodipicolinate synthase [Methanospirillum]MDX8550727.1 4-hydroxy-tetrahydrodipicolinate synthase [Methanospirillum hungatei]NLW77021.1 4-hydroxy-tetrahydrodipicolinate synthase [Methanomicrobiales archaeon]QVV90282.1 4-hydroxy-tetrahydrodipicolinate synthase [Methanospirillum sp. J.3.6.1-F.2.7.3]QXO94670.1 4-hydroxy-tetrahydrodipicolinate synthase [Methanospirillum hungatei]
MFEGVFPALITPFQRNHGRNLDLDGLRSNIAHLVAAGVHGVVPCGSTGESATLSFAEHEQVVEVTIDEAGGKVPVLAGTGSNNTSEALRFTRAAKDAGADGVLVISPYYNKPNRSGLVKHYTALADCDIPVVVYNVPGRTGQNVTPDVIAELAKHPNIVGVKEASGDVGQISSIIELTKDEDFSVISGDDNLTLPILALGGKGVISVAANLYPKPMIEMYDAVQNGDYQTARDIHYTYSLLFRSMFIESNPIPVKKAAELLGMAAGPLRLPLDEASEQTTAKLKEVLSRYD